MVYALAVEVTSAHAAPAAVGPGQAKGMRWTVGWAILILLTIGVIRFHRLDVPLERDEGEYAYSAQLMLDGTPPFAAAYNMKLPGIYAVYALILRAFGATTSGIHFGLLVVNLTTIAALLVLGRRLLGPLGGLCAAATFGVAALDPAVTGLFANSEHFVVLPLVLGALALLRARESAALLPHALAGLLLGTCFVIKQHGIAFVLFGAVATLFGCRARSGIAAGATWTRFGVYLASAALPFAAVCIWMASAGVFPRFWFWTFTYAATYVSQIGFSEGLANLGAQVRHLAGPLLGLWAFGAFGLIALAWHRASRPVAPWLAALALFSFLATCPGMLFREHYFVLVLPAAGLLAGLGVVALRSLALRWLATSWRASTALAGWAFAIAALAPLGLQNEYLLRLSDLQVSRFTYGPNPFPEAVLVGDYIRARTKPHERIAVIGSEPEIYFYADRRAATGHIYTYALMEEHPFAKEMQKEMMAQIETAKPAFVVYVNVPSSWLMRPTSHPDILKWTPGFLDAHYTQVGLLDIIGLDRTDQFWGADVVGKKPSGVHWLGIYQRTP